jgi:hypothetical protein
VVIACGIAWQRHEPRIQATLRQHLPASLQRLAVRRSVTGGPAGFLQSRACPPS